MAFRKESFYYLDWDGEHWDGEHGRIHEPTGVQILRRVFIAVMSIVFLYLVSTAVILCCRRCRPSSTATLQHLDHLTRVLISVTDDDNWAAQAKTIELRVPLAKHTSASPGPLEELEMSTVQCEDCEVNRQIGRAHV